MKIQLLSPAILFSQQWAAAAVSGRTPRIVGGDKVGAGEYEDYAYAVSLQSYQAGFFGLGGGYSHYCGASLIAKDVLLCAAHCGPAKTNDRAVIGRRDLDSSAGHSVKVASSIRHPNYIEAKTDSDVMLVFLESPTNHDVFVKLNSDSSLPANDESVIVSGWGSTREGGSISDELRAVEKKAMTNVECSASSDGRESYQGSITSRMLCASDPGEDSCQGDSGGPLVLERPGGHVQVGVVSWGYGCANPSFPGVYARVSSFYPWIKEQVCSRSSYPPAEFNCPGSTGINGSSGPDIVEPEPAPVPAPVPAPKPAPTPPSSAECTDDPSWVDIYGDGCSWYEANDSSGCPTYGSYGAAENCCHCGRGEASAPGPSPTPAAGGSGGSTLNDFTCSWFGLWC